MKIKLSFLRFAVFALYLYISLYIVFRDGYKAQDFEGHLDNAKLILSGISPWDLKATNPPLLYLSAAFFIKLFGELNGMKYLAILFTLLNAFGFYFFWYCLKDLFTKKFSLIVFGFLISIPAFISTSLIYSADALVLLPFFLFCFLNMKMLKSRKAPSLKILLGSCLTQIVGGLSKFTFIGLAPAAGLITLYLAYQNKRNIRDVLIIFLFLFFIPTSINYSIMKSFHGLDRHHVTFPHPCGDMSIRSLVFPYKNDLQLLSAPTYFDEIRIDGKQITVTPEGNPDPNGRPGYTLLANNKYSYFGLLNLSLHSDILNIAKRRFKKDNSFRAFGEYKQKNQVFQILSVFLGTILSFIFLFSFCYWIFQFFKSINSKLLDLNNLLRSKKLHYLIAMIFPALIFFTLIVGMLPFLGEAYYGGNWLPRFTIPSLLIFSAFGVYFAEKYCRSILSFLLILKIITHFCLFIV